ncbi:hypothetical protein LRP67_16680 [Nocardioides sp. cx-169]|uniref:hypothetical protein n=1 Tax=Nocardioides sp. cx-169 TaxID=2899080 RepID=UPI001E5BE184|nr:hypothetical protein [Nocardioides sp. cx-169]MCD4535728.1 hypothetical protein [Nocardioides sp. cx-169]
MLTSLRIVVGAMMAFLLLIALSLSFVLAPSGSSPPDQGLLDAPAPWVPAALLAGGVALHLVITAVGYRTPAIVPGTPPEVAGRAAAGALTSGTFLRAALAESLALLALALAFVLIEGGFVTYLCGAAVSLALSALHAFPREATIRRTEESLERQGGTSYLRQQLSLPAPRSGAVQEL